MSTAPAAAYIDSSALVKLVIPEPESEPLRAELGRWRRHVSSAVARVEVIRACSRVDSAAQEVAEQVVNAIDLISLDDDLLDAAARLEPAELRSLDAIHLASALILGDALGVAITFDERMRQAMIRAGVPTADLR